MKKLIPIFVAGAKNLRPQRLSLKAMANDLNAEFHAQKTNVILQMCSYENFGDHQHEYNQFIEEASSLVIFVLDGGIGEYTADEFILAANKYKKDKSPEILVFLKEFGENRTPDIIKVEKMMAEAFGSDFYYISYSSTEDLCSKARERIRQHVRRVMRRRNIMRQCIWLVLIALLGVSCFTTIRYFSSRKIDPTIVFVGGGSAANYFLNHYGYNVGDGGVKNSLYINFPSRQGYLLLANEVFEHHADKSEHELVDALFAKNNYFYPVLLSASTAEAKDFIDSQVSDEHDSFVEKGIVISYFLGYDSLVVHFHYLKQEDVPAGMSNEPISVDELEQIVRYDTLMRIYSTRPNSGTRKAYQEHLTTQLDSIKGDRVGIFYGATLRQGGTTPKSLHDDIRTKNYKGFVLLCSANYSLEKYKRYQQDNPSTYFVRPLTVGDSVIQKPTCLYFVAYKNKNDGYYHIPAVARDFLISFLPDLKDSASTMLELKNVTAGEVVRPLQDFRFINPKTED